MSASSRAACPRIRQAGRPLGIRLAAIALVVTSSLAACDSSTPTPPSSPAGSPATLVDAVAPVQASPSSGDPAPSASAVPQPTSTPDPETVRKAAADGYLAASDANSRAFRALVAKPKGSETTEADIWGQFAADLKHLQVPADMAADLRDLIRKVTKLQAWNVEASGHFARMDDFYVVARHRRNAQSRMSEAIDRVRADLDLPALCRAGCP